MRAIPPWRCRAPAPLRASAIAMRAPPRWRCRHCRVDARRAAMAAAARFFPVHPHSGGRPRRLDRPVAAAREHGVPTSAAWASNTASTSAGCAPVTTGTPRFMMPAFSAAIFSSVSPSSSRWSMEIEAIAEAAGGLDHVGGIAAAAEAHLQNAEIGRGAREQQEGNRHQHFEFGDRGARVHALDLGRACRPARRRSRACPRCGCARRSAPDAGRCRRARASPPPRRSRAGRRRCCPCRWCRRHGAPAAGVARDGRAWPTALQAVQAEVDQPRIKGVQPLDDGFGWRPGLTSLKRRPAPAPAAAK